MTSPAGTPAPRPDAEFWRHKSLDELQGDAEPWPSSSDDFVIEDLTAEESANFWAALRE